MHKMKIPQILTLIPEIEAFMCHFPVYISVYITVQKRINE